MNKPEELEANCPKCENQGDGLVMSSNREIVRIDKNNTTIFMRVLAPIQGEVQNITQGHPARGYLCDKCDAMFGIRQVKFMSNAMPIEDMKKIFQMQGGEINE